tara:strand:- start:370 stop:1110 length:741 start_codon:yes stop_codon:yes gene_type:complete
MARGYKKVLFIPDTHIPYNDRRAWKVLIKSIKQFQPEILVILGDFADCFSVSKHDKSPIRKTLLHKEVDAVRDHLEQLEGLEIKRKIYVAGNHEYRLERYITQKAPELFGLVDIPTLLKLPQNNWEYVEYKRHICIGDLAVSHDYGSAGQTAHRTAAQRLGVPVVIGHTHRAASITRRSFHGKHTQSAMFGWLGDVSEVDYMHQASAKTNWSTGFGIGYLLKSGEVVLHHIPIIGGAAILEGVIVK